MNKMERCLIALGVVAGFAGLSGCAATSVALEHHALNVQTKMTDSIFLQPASAKTVFVDVHNTSDKSDFSLTQQIDAALQAKGFSLVSAPQQAQYELQVNVLNVGKGAVSANAIAPGVFGTPVDDALAGAAVANSMALGGRGIGNLGLAAGAAGFISSALVKDVTFHAITDVQVSERSATAVSVSNDQTLSQGSQGSEDTHSDSTSHWQRYRTRVYSLADKVNLSWEQARPALESGLAQTITGIL